MISQRDGGNGMKEARLIQHKSTDKKNNHEM